MRYTGRAEAGAGQLAYISHPLQKICRGIGPNQITAEHRDVAIFFSLLSPTTDACGLPETHSESTAVFDRLV